MTANNNVHHDESELGAHLKMWETLGFFHFNKTETGYKKKF